MLSWPRITMWLIPQHLPANVLCILPLGLQEQCNVEGRFLIPYQATDPSSLTSSTGNSPSLTRNWKRALFSIPGGTEMSGLNLEFFAWKQMFCYWTTAPLLWIGVHRHYETSPVSFMWTSQVEWEIKWQTFRLTAHLPHSVGLVFMQERATETRIFVHFSVSPIILYVGISYLASNLEVIR